MAVEAAADSAVVEVAVVDLVTVVAVGTLVTGRTGRAVRAHVWWHAALQLAVALSIWWAEVRSDVARHLVRWTSLVAAASTELAEAGVLCRLELFINSVKEAAKRSRKGVALLRWRAGGTVRRTIGVLSRAVVWVWWWRRWAERHREVVHHVLMSWLDGQNEELAVLVLEKLDGDLINSHRLVVEAEDLEVKRDDLVSVG